MKFKAIIIKIIGDIGEIAIDKKSELLTLNVLNILGNIGVKAVDKNLTVADYPIAEKAQSSAYQIKFSEHNIIKDLFEIKICHEAAANFIHNQLILHHNFDFEDLEQDLAKFVKIYESC